MADIIINIALGIWKRYFELPETADAIICVVLESSGLEADNALRDHNDLAALLGATTNEQTTMGRKTVAGIVITVDDTNNRLDIDISDIVWTAATGNAVGALLFTYDNDTGAGTDSNIIPVSKHDFTVTPDGSDVTAVIAAAGLVRATG